MPMNLSEIVQQDRQQLAALEDKLAYRFIDPSLLLLALIHSSYAFEQGLEGQDNEILEFIGDAVLDLAVGCLLTSRYATMREGALTRLRSALVNESNLAAMAVELRLGRFLYLGKGEDATQGRKKPSIMSGAYEAVVGAILQDGNYDAAAIFVKQQFLPLLDRKKAALLLSDAKSTLQERLQKEFNTTPTYHLLNEEGPAHDKRFTVSVMFRDTELGRGTAKNKKEAEQRAATEALRTFDSSRVTPAVIRDGTQAELSSKV